MREEKKGMSKTHRHTVRTLQTCPIRWLTMMMMTSDRETVERKRCSTTDTAARGFWGGFLVGARIM